MYWTKFLYELYSNSRVLVHYIESPFFFFFFVSIIHCHNCSYSAILNSFLYLEIQLYDSFSLSLLHVHWILCYRIKNISFMVSQSNWSQRYLCSVNDAEQLEPCLLRWGLWVRFPSLGLEENFFLSFPPLLSLLSLHWLRCAFTQVCASLWAGSCASGGPAFLP